MIRKPISAKTDFSIRVVSIVFFILCYSALSWRQHQINSLDTTIPGVKQFVKGITKIVSPAPAKKDGTIVEKVTSTWLVKDLAASGYRLFTGLIIGVSLAFVLGLAMGVYKPAESFFRWPILVLGNIPATAMLAVYFVLFGMEMKMYIAMISLSILPALAGSIYNAVISDVSDHAIYKAYTLGASPFEVIFEVIVRQILPRIIDAVRLSVGPAMVFLIAAEWNSADVGFGYRLRIQGRLLEMSVVYTYLALLGLSGFLIDFSLVKLRQYLCPWFDLRS